MQAIKLNVEQRSTGKAAARSIRNAGNVPCVLYGRDIDPVHFQVSELSLRPLIFTHETHTVEVELDGETWPCILRDIDFDPVSDEPIHADFLLLTEGQTIRMTIPIQLIGTPAGQLEGGMTQQVISELEIECLPKDIPGHVELDVAALEIGDTLHVSDVEIENVTILTPPERTIVTIAGALPEEEELLEEELEEGEEGLEGEEGEEGEGEKGEGAEGEASEEDED
jgi:large subunit ribosomal protein L25